MCESDSLSYKKDRHFLNQLLGTLLVSNPRLLQPPRMSPTYNGAIATGLKKPSKQPSVAKEWEGKRTGRQDDRGTGGPSEKDLGFDQC